MGIGPVPAVERALAGGHPVQLGPVERHRRPDPATQRRELPVPRQPSLVHAAEPAEG